MLCMQLQINNKINFISEQLSKISTSKIESENKIFFFSFFVCFPLLLVGIGCKVYICPAQNLDNKKWATSNDYKLYFPVAKCTCINGPNGHTHGNPHGSRFLFMTKKLPHLLFL